MRVIKKEQRAQKVYKKPQPQFRQQPSLTNEHKEPSAHAISKRKSQSILGINPPPKPNKNTNLKSQ
jgi:hypothetical protein